MPKEYARFRKDSLWIRVDARQLSRRKRVPIVASISFY